jgi:hypothetical protein
LEFSYTNLQEDHETLTQVFEYSRDENTKTGEALQAELEASHALLEEQKQLCATEVERHARLLEEVEQIRTSASQDDAEKMEAHHKAIEELAAESKVIFFVIIDFHYH